MHWLIAAPIILFSLAAATIWEAWCVVEKLSTPKTELVALSWFGVCMLGIFIFGAPGGIALAWAIMN